MPSSPARLSLDSYLAPFAPDFRRKERAAWARVYLEGLLADRGRKTVEGIARAVPLPPDLRADDARQALHNFIQESPWDEGQLWQRLRRALWPTAGDGVLVVDDVTLVKQGRHSVGVHRQLSPDQGKKLNCQVIPTVFLVADDVAAPVAMRLYLPYAWQADPDRLAASKVPDEYRRACSKFQVALDLLARLRAEDVPVRRLHAGDGYRRHDGFRDGVGGLDFELAETEEGPSVQALVARLKEQLGLDHFEGRSWRGLHHHLCLVALAYGYLLSEE